MDPEPLDFIYQYQRLQPIPPEDNICHPTNFFHPVSRNEEIQPIWHNSNHRLAETDCRPQPTIERDNRWFFQHTTQVPAVSKPTYGIPITSSAAFSAFGHANTNREQQTHFIPNTDCTRERVISPVRPEILLCDITTIIRRCHPTYALATTTERQFQDMRKLSQICTIRCILKSRNQRIIHIF
jgi:hypothetical protein